MSQGILIQDMKVYCLAEKGTNLLFPCFYRSIPDVFRHNDPVSKFMNFLRQTAYPSAAYPSGINKSSFYILDKYCFVEPNKIDSSIYVLYSKERVYKELRHSLNEILRRIYRRIKNVSTIIDQNQKNDLQRILDDISAGDDKALTKNLFKHYYNTCHIIEIDFSTGKRLEIPLESACPKNLTSLSWTISI